MIKENEIDYNTYELNISPELIHIEKNRIIEILGYNSLPEHFDLMLDNVLSDIKKKLNIRAGYKIIDDYKLLDNKEGFFISRTFFKTGKIVTTQLGKIESVAVFILTAGFEIDKWIKELNEKGETLLSYLVDITASEATEKIADVLHDYIKSKMKNFGLNVTNRYSPGYCNWDVSEQQKLFSLLPRNFCGVKLTESSLMIPVKSISGIIGIGKKAKWKNYLCDKCGISDCTYRKIISRNKSKKHID
ncbi:vitamin B12 dependent-methionine synthase activation domain-containing protein [Rosettibacter firmus]|uniref:vitamin B12 dependent-methionine synthase activation domain-containing protein n=1 Tax=Rosettibacter firmus TaxID=3111522 RepID=UPI00336BCB96